MNNDELMVNLNKWARENARMCPDVSTCRFYYGECNAIGVLNGKHCMMSYVGRRYGEDDQFRLAVVGIDHVDPESGNFEDRRTGDIECGHVVQGRRGFCFFGKRYESSACIFNLTAGCRPELVIQATIGLDEVGAPSTNELETGYRFVRII